MSEQIAEREAACEGCGGQGWYVSHEGHPMCCGQSEWACGDEGCTGLIEEWTEIQVQCDCQREHRKDEHD